MSDTFPIKHTTDKPEDTRIVELGSNQSQVVLDALSSKTTRTVLLEIHSEPASISQVSNRVDSSIQNIKYHIDKLNEAGLVEETGEWHTEGGNQMTLYGPTDKAILLVASDDDPESVLKRAVKKFTAILFGTVASATVLYKALSYSSSTGSNQMTTNSGKIQTATQPSSFFSSLPLSQELIGAGLLVVGIFLGVLLYILADKYI